MRVKILSKGDKMRIVDFNLKIKKLSESAVIPEYKTEGASGMDLCSTERITIMPFERRAHHSYERGLPVVIQLGRSMEGRITAIRILPFLHLE